MKSNQPFKWFLKDGDTFSDQQIEMLNLLSFISSNERNTKVLE